MCGPIAAVAGFFKDTFEELNYIKMKYKNILISSHGDVLLMVVDLKKHRKREHVDWICQQLLQKPTTKSIEEPHKEEDLNPTESGIESGAESDIERKNAVNPDHDPGHGKSNENFKSSRVKEMLIASVADNIKRL